MLTFELEDAEVLHVHFDGTGLKTLQDALSQLSSPNGEQAEDHVHLMTKEWGSGELSSELQAVDSSSSIINSVTLHRWKG